jgi:hypothetical protein
MHPVELEIFGVFTREMREDVAKRMEKRHCKGETQGIIPDILIGTDLYELKGIRSDASHSNYNGAQVAGVEKREKKIPIEIAKQAVLGLDKGVFGIGEPTTGPWQRKLRTEGAGGGQAWDEPPYGA